MFLFGVVPPLVVFLPLYGVLWGAGFAAIHGVFMVVMGVLVIEFALRRTDGMPCAQPWDPETLDLGRWWWAYLIGFILYTTKVPDLEMSLVGQPVGIAGFAALSLVLSIALRTRSLQRPVPDTDTKVLVSPVSTSVSFDSTSIMTDWSSATAPVSSWATGAWL